MCEALWVSPLISLGFLSFNVHATILLALPPCQGPIAHPHCCFSFWNTPNIFFLPQDLCAYCLCLDCLDCLAFGMGGFVLTFGSQLFNIILKINLFFFFPAINF